MSPQEAIYQACLLRFRPIMTTMAALLGGLPRAWNGNGKRTAAAAGHHDCGRTDCVAGVDAVYDAGGLFVL
jgi:hypothetical protein